MVEKIFIVGRSGSGKTTADRIIAKSISRIELPTQRFKDYEILYKMYQEDRTQRNLHYRDHKFRKAKHKGFEVVNYSVFDEALKKLENEVTNKVPTNYNGIVTIEFARNNYQHALSKFSPDFLENAHLLFIDCKVEECIRRIYKRISNPPRPDFHFVPERIMRSYFSKDNIDYRSYFGDNNSGDTGKHYKTDFPSLKQVKSIDNTGLSLEKFQEEVRNFANLVVESYLEKTPVEKILVTS